MGGGESHSTHAHKSPTVYNGPAYPCRAIERDRCENIAIRQTAALDTPGAHRSFVARVWLIIAATSGWHIAHGLNTRTHRYTHLHALFHTHTTTTASWLVVVDGPPPCVATAPMRSEGSIPPGVSRSMLAVAASVLAPGLQAARLTY